MLVDKLGTWPAVLIVGTVRDCAAQLPRSIARLRRAFSACPAVHWLLVESDSSDATVAVLQRLSNNLENFRYLSLGRLAEAMPLRTERIAYCRNRCVDEASEQAYRDIDSIVVADFDGANRLLTAKSLATCWTRGEWDVVAANQLGLYYDIWALRHPEWSPNDCWAQYRALREIGGLDHEQACWAAVWGRMICVPPGRDWIEVDSAFGGLALYRAAAFRSARYHGLDADGRETCEHVPFHAQLRAQGRRIFINPELVNDGLNEHSLLPPLTPQLLRARRRVSDALRRVGLRRG